MSWRTVVVSSSAKLDYQMGYLVVRKDTTVKIHLSEIGILLVESTAVSLTAVLILVMFDLPVGTDTERREYYRFRKHLIKTGFLMMQESVYCKIVQNSVAADNVVENIKKNKPQEGLVQVLRITEKQYSKMEYIVGKKQTEVIGKK